MNNGKWKPFIWMVVVAGTAVLPASEPLPSAVEESVGTAEGTQELHSWEERIALADSSLSQSAIENIETIDTQMIFHMSNLQDRVQQDLIKTQPVIVVEFTPGGGKFTLLRNEHGNETRLTVEPVPTLFALSKSIAHASLGIYGCLGPYSADLGYQGWRERLAGYGKVMEQALKSVGDIKDGKDGFEIDEELKTRLVEDLNTLTGKFGGSDTRLTEETVVPHIVDVFQQILNSNIDFIEDETDKCNNDKSLAQSFREWNEGDTLYNWIVQCEVIAVTAQQYGISTLIKRWRDDVENRTADWDKLYVIVEAEWATTELNSIAQCIRPYMTGPEGDGEEHLLIVTDLADVESGLSFLAKVLRDRAAAVMILTKHRCPVIDLSGPVDLLGPLMKDVVRRHK